MTPLREENKVIKIVNSGREPCSKLLNADIEISPQTNFTRKPPMCTGLLLVLAPCSADYLHLGVLRRHLLTACLLGVLQLLRAPLLHQARPLEAPQREGHRTAEGEARGLSATPAAPKLARVGVRARR